MMAITPGNWTAWQAPDGHWMVRTVYHDEQGRRCTAWPAVCAAGAQDNEANARLIAAAPELLATLRISPCPRPCNDRPDGFTAGECCDARECGCTVGAAIAKAEGR